MHDVELIYDAILQYNVDNMNNKNEVPDEVGVIQELKSEFIEAAFKERDAFPQEIPWDCYVEVDESIGSTQNLFSRLLSVRSQI